MIQFNDFLAVHTPQLTPESGAVAAPYHWDRKWERVNKLTYNYANQKWVKTQLKVEIEHRPFSEGSCRAAYRMKVEGQPGSFVAKKSKTAHDPRASYEMDVAMQAMCQEFAQRFNALNPPKKVTFLEAFLIERVELPGTPVMACEAMLQGEFHKFNNNFGYKSEDERNTPQAFSHYTYVASRGHYIVVDVQGTGDAKTADVYTDPQIHAPNLPQTAFGKGNMGYQGVQAFFQTHKCNSICVGLGLSNKLQDHIGTVMNPARIPGHAAPPANVASGHSSPPRPSPLVGAAAAPPPRPGHFQGSPISGGGPIASPAFPGAGSPFSSPHHSPSGGGFGQPIPQVNSSPAAAGEKSGVHHLVHRGKEKAHGLLRHAGIVSRGGDDD